MSDLAILNNDPPKAFLINLETNDRWDAQFNPSTLEEAVEANYERLKIRGLSHERLQYSNTGNKTIPLEFFLSQQRMDEMFGIGTFSILDDKAWLESLLYPAADIDYSYQGAPQVLFVWPGNLRMKGRVMSVEFMNRDFSARDGIVNLLVARLEFEEDREFRILMDEVREYGGQRFRQRLPGEEVESGGG